MMKELANPSEEPQKQTLKILLDNPGPVKHARWNWLEANVYARVEVLDVFFGRRKMHSELLVKKRNVVAESKGERLRLSSNFPFFLESFLFPDLSCDHKSVKLTGREWRHTWYDAEIKVACLCCRTGACQ
jgi:hypothetical protein